MSRAHVIGLDFETSGSDHAKHVPIQIGLATPDGEVSSWLVGGYSWVDRPWTEDKPGTLLAEWSTEAEGIHNISRADLESAPWAAEVDRLAAKFVTSAYPGVPTKWVNAVGWNVAGFDFPFLRRFFPKTSRNISYRSIDLNAVVFAITESGMPGPTGEPYDYFDLKSRVKDAAAYRIERQADTFRPDRPIPTWHDAGYDALAALYAYEELKGVLRRAS